MISENEIKIFDRLIFDKFKNKRISITKESIFSCFFSVLEEDQHIFYLLSEYCNIRNLNVSSNNFCSTYDSYNSHIIDFELKKSDKREEIEIKNNYNILKNKFENLIKSFRENDPDNTYKNMQSIAEYLNLPLTKTEVDEREYKIIEEKITKKILKIEKISNEINIKQEEYNHTLKTL